MEKFKHLKARQSGLARRPSLACPGQTHIYTMI